jgi:glutamate racemase
MHHDVSKGSVDPGHGGACRIGVFDSGVGGLSILRALQQRLPDIDLHYLADSRHAPYGERDPSHAMERSMRITQHLIEQGATMIVVACNTATAIAVAALRERWPARPIVGVEPGLKPALALTRNGRIGVMATATTLRSEKFARLAASLPLRHGLQLRACDGLAAAIERGDLDDPALRALVEAHCAPLRDAGVDCVVLGCTHYAFVAPQIQAALGPHVRLVDTADAVADQAQRLLAPLPCGRAATGASARVRLETTGDVARLARLAEAWLPFACRVDAAPAGL